MRNNIKEIRESKGIKQSELAKKTGLLQANLSRYESRSFPVENMTVKVAAAIADALGCSIEELYREPEFKLRSVYFVRSYDVTIKDADFEYTEGCTIEYEASRNADFDTEEIMRTESLDEALAELAKHESFAKRNGFDHKEWFVKEYWIDEEHWDYDDPEDPQFYDLVGSVKYAHCDIIE